MLGSAALRTESSFELQLELPAEMKLLQNIINIMGKEKPLDINEAFSNKPESLPTLWLLGKTGSGKSSLIQAVTGSSHIEIGNGFSPCTRTACSYEFPIQRPLIRFLDTRGLGEPGYDPARDIEACKKRSHALIIVMKAEEPEQSSVLRALRLIRKSSDIKHAILAHTGVNSIAGSQELKQCVMHNQHQAENAWGRSLESYQVDFESAQGKGMGVAELKSGLAELLPVISLFNLKQDHMDGEKAGFEGIRSEILWYAGVAGASDVLPVAGTVTVPGIQARMLHALAGRYGLKWDPKAMAQFAGALGAGFAAQYAARLGVRQVIKLIPAYGQTVGTTAAAMASFCSTYALGRVACKYLYHKTRDESVDPEELKKMYAAAFENIQEVAGSETGKSRH